MTAPAAARPRLSREQQLERELRIALWRMYFGRRARGRRLVQRMVARRGWR